MTTQPPVDEPGFKVTVRDVYTLIGTQNTLIMGIQGTLGEIKTLASTSAVEINDHEARIRHLETDYVSKATARWAVTVGSTLAAALGTILSTWIGHK